MYECKKFINISLNGILVKIFSLSIAFLCIKYNCIEMYFKTVFDFTKNEGIIKYDIDLE